MNAVAWTGALVCVALILQSFELLFIKPYPWTIVKRENPRFLHPLLRSYKAIVVLQLLVAIEAVVMPSPVFALILLFTQWLIAVRWRGTFNGASDSMTFLVTAAWLVSFFAPAVGLWYIAIQATLSYFVAGVSKVRQREWQTGKAIAHFLERSPRRYDLVLAWTVIGFEVLFPLAYLSPVLTLVFLAAGLSFHLVNAYAFGLNRFVFAWLATYPAILWATMNICGWLYS